MHTKKRACRVAQDVGIWFKPPPPKKKKKKKKPQYSNVCFLETSENKLLGDQEEQYQRRAPLHLQYGHVLVEEAQERTPHQRGWFP
jgi:hypothetical protein